MRVKLCDIADVKFGFPEKYKKDEIGETAFWVTAAILQKDNVVGDLQLDESLRPMEQFEILEDDIIIKRINPTYVNFISKLTSKCYAGNNLIIVRSKKDYFAKYIAFTLNEVIEKFVKDSSVGSIMPALNKSDLDNFIINVPALKEQKAISEIWYKSIEKKKMAVRLAELENIKENYLINKYIKNQNGGKTNDNIWRY